LEPPLPVCDQVLNADSLFSRAHHRFALAERFIDVELPGSWSVAHWTSPLAIKARNIPNFYTLHDLIPLRFPHFVIDKAGRDVRLHEKIAQQADHIITVSESSKRDIVELLGVADDRVSVTYQPVPSLPTLAREAAERLVRNLYGVKPGRYAIFLGAIEPKKNLKRLIEAFLVAGADIPLLLAGPLGWLYEEELDLIDTISQVGQDGAPVRRLGYLPRRHVVALLQCARLFVFPSIYEGFGLPVLEAMQLGVPVLSSRTSSLMEVAGEAAVLADPLDVSAMAHEIRRLVNDPDLRAELARRGPIQAAKFDAAGYRDRLAAAYLKAGVKIAGTPAIRKLSKWEVTNEHIEAQSPYELEHG
jgi:glycosyltransferase involved in cell wall biosynthesis